MRSSRREFLRSGLAIAALPASSRLSIGEETGTHHTLWYRGEAKRWMEALPVGNGRLGGMVFGGLQKERIALTESTAWSGAPSTADVNRGGVEHLTEIRRHLFAGDYAQARKLCEENLLSHSTSYGTHLPLLDLVVAFDVSNKAERYRRELDLASGLACVEYLTGAYRVRREVFSSNPDDVLVVHLQGGAPKQLNCKVALEGAKVPGRTYTLAPDTLGFTGHAFESLHSSGSQGVDLECRVRVLQTGGEVRTGANHLQIINADAATLLVAVATTYAGGVPARACADALDSACVKTYATLRQNHIADHRALYGRVQIDLGSTAAAEHMPTDERRKAVEAGASDPGLTALFFQYGRYLTIAGSRWNSPLPLALQGIWNDGLASSMPWTDDFHLDINTQQNYWLAEVGNLAESQMPLFALIDQLVKSGRVTAKELYGAPGWVSHVFTNPWGYTAPGWGLDWGLFVTSGIWIALQMWEHYRFGGDADFLRQRLYPVFKAAAEFYLAYMVEHPKYGWLVTGPSDSPENAFRTPSGGTCGESMGPTCDRVLVYALFSICLEAQALLSTDLNFGMALKRARDQLAPLQIGRYGQLQEWLEDFEEAEPNHRHTSHLIALYPESQISPEKTPELAKAARITLERRINRADWEDTEWSRANLVNYYARLLDGDTAHYHLVGLIAKATEDNLLTYSRGGVAGAAHNIFAIDGNTAGAAGIAEMLLQSQGNAIHLLPALPTAWPDGIVRGLCARGGFQVEMRWRSGRLVSATISSKRGGSCEIRYQSRFVSIHLAPGKQIKLSDASFLDRRT